MHHIEAGRCMFSSNAMQADQLDTEVGCLAVGRSEQWLQGSSSPTPQLLPTPNTCCSTGTLPAAYSSWTQLSTFDVRGNPLSGAPT
jgi:hypothetical protein